MTASHVRRVLAVSLCTACALYVSVLQADSPPATGDLWQVVSQMSMEGMPIKMPAQRLQVCAAKVWNRPPGADNSERGCTSSDMAVDEDTGTVTWTSVCADGMAGHGVITLNGDDAYTGTLRYTSDEGDVIINLEGHKIGECDHPQ